jgi:RNA polymerase primary sigma factor
MNIATLTPYLRDIQAYPSLSREDEIALFKKCRKGDNRASEQLVTSNLRVVVNIARQYQHLGLPLPDLISEGSIGLINAIDQFDETRGVRFASFAAWLVKRQIFHALADTAKLVKLPVKQLLSLRHEYKKLQALAQQLRHSEASLETIKHLEKKIARITRKLDATTPFLSLDAPLMEDETRKSFKDVLPEDEDRRPDRIACQKIDQDYVHRALAELDERERTVLELYYGLRGQEPKSLQEIGTGFGLSRERVRQIKQGAIDKLRRSLHVRN